MALQTREREALREADKAFPGGKEKITMRQANTDPAFCFDAVRRGAMEMASVPFVNPSNHQHLDARIRRDQAKRFDRMDPTQRQRLAAGMKKSLNDRGADIELAAYREFELTSDVMAIPWSLAAFQTVNLSADELLYVKRPRSRNMQRFTVRSMAQDGGARLDQWQTTQQSQVVDMDMISSDKVSYPLWDLQQGDIGQFDAVNESVTYDLGMKIDVLAKTNIDNAQMNSGLRASLHIHPSVVAANIPDTNYLDLTDSSYGLTGHLTIEKLKIILSHVAQFGSAGGADVPISINTIMMSPQNIRDPWDFTNLTSNFSGGPVQPPDTVPTSVRESIWNTGMISSAWGQTFSWTPNAQLDIGRMYILTSQPLGWMMTKSEYDHLYKWDANTSADYAIQNKGEILMQRALTFWVPDEWRYRIVIIDL